jgi:hypothetical protein
MSTHYSAIDTGLPGPAACRSLQELPAQKTLGNLTRRPTKLSDRLSAVSVKRI